MPVLTVTSTPQLQKKIDKECFVLVDFYADWCQPCIKGAPIFENKSNESRYKKIKFIKLNVDLMDEDEKDEFKIKSIPLLYLYENGIHTKTRQGLTESSIDIMLSHITN